MQRSAPEPEIPPLFQVPELRVDALAKVTGGARFAADAAVPGMLWAAFRQSDVPHAILARVDIARALRMPGVHAVLTGAETGAARFGRRLLDQPALATDRVRFVGERIAVVAAETREIAEAAAQAISVEYDELTAILDPEEALAANAPVLHEAREDYPFLGGPPPAVPHPNVQGRRVISKRPEDLPRAMANAARVFEHEFTVPRQHHGYIEPHATLVWLNDAGMLHVVSTNKTPFSLRNQLAMAMSLEASEIDVDSGFIGGDFGGKGYTPDEFACAFLARATRRPIKFVSSYAQELGSYSTRHPARIRLRSAVDSEGKIVAHEARLLLDGGAYASAKPLPDLMLPSANETMAPYAIPCVSIEAIAVYTNHLPGGHMRSPGAVQSVFAGESHVDAIARALGRDPIEFRLANALREGQSGPGGELYREARAEAVLNVVRDRPRTAGSPRRGTGRGVAVWGHHVGIGKTTVRALLEKNGDIVVLASVPDQGAGAHTVINRVVASVLGVPADVVRVEHASTSLGIVDAGVGSSRVTHIASRAAAIAAERLKDQIERAATELLSRSGAAMRLREGAFTEEGVPTGLSAELADIAPQLVEACGGRLEAEGTFDAAAPKRGEEPGDHDFAACLVEVSVDPDTGQVHLLDIALAVDVGTIINPVAHQGQLAGGVAFGIGAALMEELVVEDGRVTTLNLGDYKLPTTMDVPPLETFLVPTPVGPGAFGAKMVGELSNPGIAPAIANAVADAVGVRVYELPIRAEAIWRAVRSQAVPADVKAPDR